MHCVTVILLFGKFRLFRLNISQISICSWSAAKGVGRITGKCFCTIDILVLFLNCVVAERLPAELADEVVVRFCYRILVCI